MSFRFRRTLKVLPGLRLNLTTRGISVRAGVRGAGITTGTNGTTVGAGIPGSGLHYSKKVGLKRTKAAKEEKPGILSTLFGLFILIMLLGFIFG